MPETFDFDLFVIGAGSGGVRASRMAADFGARVGIAEKSDLGGTCVNVGCVPKKLLVYGSVYAQDFADAQGFGWTLDAPSFDWQTLIQNKDREITRLNGIYDSILSRAGVKLFPGDAQFRDAHTLDVNGDTITAKHILIATGGWPSVPDIPGHEHGITSNEVFHLPALPERMLIVGGGYIAVEFAGIMHGFGSQLTQIYRGDLFLRGFDSDIRQALRDEMRKRGVDLRFNLDLQQIERSDDALHCVLSDGTTMDVDAVLFATGRRPLTKALGLELAGVATDSTGAIPVDAYSQTSVPGIHAIGDVTNRMNLTPVAIHEGMALAETLFNDNPSEPDYTHVPTAVFSQPNCGTIGLTEEAARDAGHEPEVYRSSFRPLRHAMTGRDEQTMVKLIVDKSDDRVLGVHLVGPDAGEIVQGFAVALRCGATKKQFDQTIGVHPTTAEELVTLRKPV
jgi:glutathione reductase (NADPH)